MLIGTAVSAAYTFTQVPLYRATSVVFVSTSSGNSLIDLAQGSDFTQQRVQTYASLVSTPKVIQPVINELGLGMTPAKLARFISASVPLNTTLIKIDVENAHPDRAATIANKIAASLSASVVVLEGEKHSDDSPVRLTQVSPAVAPQTPVSPNIPLYLTLGGLIGLAMAIAVAVMRDVFDTRIRGINDLQAITKDPIIGAIPFDPQAKKRPIILQSDPQNPLGEAFRGLRTNLQFLDLSGDRTFVITSSVPGEGKTTTAINLAIALADAGKRVALVDADLRRPQIADYLRLEGSAGLSNLLIGELSLEQVLQPWGTRELFVLPSGTRPPNPNELLASPQMSSLITTLSEYFDAVIIDCPPLLPVADAAILARLTAGALVVVRASRTNQHQLSASITALETIDAKVAGLVLSMVPLKGADSYSYYGYGYGYGHPDARDAAESTEKRHRKGRRDRNALTTPQDFFMDDARKR